MERYRVYGVTHDGTGDKGEWCCEKDEQGGWVKDEDAKRLREFVEKILEDEDS